MAADIIAACTRASALASSPTSSGGTLIRQWKPYPSVLITGTELEVDDAPPM